MSQDKPDLALVILLDHARARAAWEPGKPSWACKDWNSSIFSEPANHDHKFCHGCGCECHRPSDRDRQLWTRIADEIDGYLAGPSDQEALL